ncbi:DUF3558 domain-containing protein [Nocardia sp. XZ_19_385]|uniref:DUF3558 domain-containing protein n=1 Tax=Nocardia sp. XZ_19_385 TaxID=2769488 RepID=UPI00188EBC58|nr:DUF3558 domain-containing protein [Nocardia sp. XZ_19_385]
MRKRIRDWNRSIGVVGLALAAAATGCQTSGTATPAPPPTVVGPSDTPPPTPPWTLAQLIYHPCNVLGPSDIDRFGFAGPGRLAGSQPNNYCQWLTLPTAAHPIKMYFQPDPWHTYKDIENLRRGEENFRTVTLAGQPAFLVDDRSESGHRNCKIWGAVASGGLFAFEFAADPGAPDDLCARATEIATVIADRLQ